MTGRRDGVTACRRFEGRVVAVTGAASGIGAACAHRFAREGAAVLLADVDEDRGEVVAKCIGDDHAVFLRCDVSRRHDWEHLRALAVDRWGRLDVLHSNAFTQTPAAAHELEEDDWDRMLAVNLKAAFLGVKVLVDLLGRDPGSIVLTSSVNAIMGRPGRPAYAAAKGGLCAMARQLAVEYGPAVRVNAVLPGPILTSAWDRVSDAAREASGSGTAAQRLGEPEEVAAAVAFLASDDASYVTGANLVVDGGWSVMKGAA